MTILLIDVHFLGLDLNLLGVAGEESGVVLVRAPFAKLILFLEPSSHGSWLTGNGLVCKHNLTFAAFWFLEPENYVTISVLNSPIRKRRTTC